MSHPLSSSSSSTDCKTPCGGGTSDAVAKEGSNARAAFVSVLVARRVIPLLVIALAMYGLHKQIEYSGWVMFVGLLGML